MNPNLQTQIFDPLRQQFVQVDSGGLATTSLLFQILVELRISNLMFQEQAAGRIVVDNLDNLRKDLINELNFTKQA